jgi:hypothetical protein
MMATTVAVEEPPLPPVPAARPEPVVVGTTTWLAVTVGVAELEGDADGEADGDVLGVADIDGLGVGLGDGLGDGDGVGDGVGLGAAATVTTPAIPLTTLQW